MGHLSEMRSGAFLKGFLQWLLNYKGYNLCLLNQ